MGEKKKAEPRTYRLRYILAYLGACEPSIGWVAGNFNTWDQLRDYVNRNPQHTIRDCAGTLAGCVAWLEASLGVSGRSRTEVEASQHLLHSTRAPSHRRWKRLYAALIAFANAHGIYDGGMRSTRDGARVEPRSLPVRSFAATDIRALQKQWDRYAASMQGKDAP